jgi:hypothetical protein
MNKDSNPSFKSYKPMTYRFIVSIDVDAMSLNESYYKLDQALAECSNKHSIEWEFTDEAYFPDGEEIDPNILDKLKNSIK